MTEFSEDDVNTGSEACYKHKFSGVYKTFRPGDVMFKPDWVFIHNGPCDCEGKSGDECQEPGDDG
jgi:hypothetical protein